MFVALLGADGSGKTSVLRAVVDEFAAATIKTKVFHWRPQFDGLTGEPLLDPHGRQPRPLYQSPLKLAFLWAAFVSGYLTRVRPALKAGHIVLFDRYYHDLLVDPRRYRFSGPMWLARMVGRFVPHPDLWILLDAPAEVLHSRKAEVAYEESERQRLAYRAMIAQLGGLRVDTSGPLHDSVRTVIDALRRHSHVAAQAKGGATTA